MTKFGKFTLIAMVAALTFSMAFPPSASAKLVRKVDNIIVLLDQSGSMGQTSTELQRKKIEAAIGTISRLDKAIPELGYNSALILASPYEVVSPLQTYENGSLSAAANKVDTSIGLRGNYTKFGTTLKELVPKEMPPGEEMAPEVQAMQGKTAVILFTDGDNNVGADPVAQTKALYDQNPNVCVHVVSLADNNSGQMMIDQVRAQSGCSESADINSLSTKAGMDRFAQNLLYEEVPDDVVVIVDKEVITFNLLFGFDKADVKDDMVPVLEQVQMTLEEDPDAEFILAGHTDSIGSEEYNQDLSQRRAAAVANWLINNGVDSARLDVIGYGETQPKFDNATEEGRELNRRVEIMAK